MPGRRYSPTAGESLHRNVPIEFRGHPGLRKHPFKMERAGHVGFRPGQLLHGLLRGDPRSAAAIPAGVIVHVDLQSHAAGFGVDVAEQVAPGLFHEIHRPHRRPLVHLHNESAADAGAPHGFKIGGDAIARDVAIEPEPINPGTRGGGRRGKSPVQIIVRRGRLYERAKQPD